jgi:hypothetical protein
MTNYVRDPGTSTAAYPYTLAALRASYPNTSFPADPPLALLAEYGVYPVVVVPPPAYDPATHLAVVGPPALVDGAWTKQWTVRELTAEELQARVPRSVSKLQGMLAIAEAGLAAPFLAWKAALDPVADFAALAFLDGAQTWDYDNELLNAALVALGVEAHKDALFTLAATL